MAARQVQEYEELPPDACINADANAGADVDAADTEMAVSDDAWDNAPVTVAAQAWVAEAGTGTVEEGEPVVSSSTDAQGADVHDASAVVSAPGFNEFTSAPAVVVVAPLTAAESAVGGEIEEGQEEGRAHV